MIRPPRCDFWQVGLVPVPMEELANAGPAAAWRDQVRWLPDPGPWRYLADPFGLQRDGRTHVFVEAFDYRTKHAVIEHHEFDSSLEWRGKEVVLSRPFHLSYPFLVREEGEIFMIPESHRAGEIALYRSREFPRKWVREQILLSGVPGAEASLIRFQGRWWMFYTVVGPQARDQRELHLAYAEQLHGPWLQHHLNPVLNDQKGARPAGSPVVSSDGALILPVQDCSTSYGGAVRFIKFTEINPDRVQIQGFGQRLTGERFSATHHDGCHTLSACGPYTLVDVKRTIRSWARHGLNLQRHLARVGIGWNLRRPASS